MGKTNKGNVVKYYAAYFPKTRERYIETSWCKFKAYTMYQSVIFHSFKTINDCNQFFDEMEEICESRRKYWDKNKDCFQPKTN